MNPSTLPLRAVAADVCVAPQLTPEAMAEAARAGFRSVVNNRPDFEFGPDQPTNASIEAAARAAGLEYRFLPVAGSFYYTPKLLNGKVYTVQNDKLPFAAVHGDPDILMPGMTRFGPTAIVLPLLERYRWSTLPEFLQVTKPEWSVMKVMGGLLREPEVRAYMLRNMLYEIPGVRERLFLKEARKIVPSLQLEQLHFAKGIGGIRPVMIDKQQQRLRLGEAQIDPGSGILFNMTPSPGATSCLGNARRDAERIIGYL